MRDDDTRPTESLDPDARTASHEHVNQPGMTNGIPDALEQGISKSYPHSEREKSEIAGGGASGNAGGDTIGSNGDGGGSEP